MEQQIMKKSYKLSRIILAILAFLIFNIMFINEDISWKFLSFIFSLITFIMSFPSSIISKKIINLGNNIKNNMIKILFYIIVLPIIIFILSILIYLFNILIFDIFPISNDFSTELGQGLLILFLITVEIICIIVPYIQTLIVLILKQMIKNK